jgi:hypothetical protein
MKNTLAILFAAIGILAVGCVTSKTTNTDGTTTTTVNTNLLQTECSIALAVDIPALTIAAIKNPSIVPVLKDIKVSLDALLLGTSTNTLAAITSALPSKYSDLAPEAQALASVLSSLEQQALAKYGSKNGVIIAVVIAQTADKLVTSVIAAVPATQ